MIAIDTNILIRFLVKDDQKQSELVYQRFKQAESENEILFIPLLVVLEVIWVLQTVYEIADNEILSAISELLLVPVLKFEAQTAIRDFVTSAYKTKFDLSDILIAHSAHFSNCQFVLTFDKKASKFKYFELLSEKT